MRWTASTLVVERFAKSLRFSQAKMYVIVFPDEDGDVAGLASCRRSTAARTAMLLDIQDDIRRHFDDCRKRQAKIQRNRELL